MKFEIEQATFAPVLNWAALALATRTPYPVLRGLYLRAYAGHVTVTGYDDLGSHSWRVPAEQIEPGSALIPGALLRDLVAALGKSRLTLRADDHGAEIETDTARYRLGVLPIDDYPPTPEPPAVVGVVERAGDLADMLSAIAPAVDDTPETARGGVRMEAAYGHLSLAGISPSLMIFRAVKWAGSDFSERLSPGMLSDALRGFEPDAALTLGTSHGLISLADETRTAVMRLYNPAELDWRGLLRPGIDPNTLTVDVAALNGALRRAALLDPATVRLTGSRGVAPRVESADARELLDAELDGEIDVRLNPSYLADAIQSVSGSSGAVRIGTTDKPRSAVIVRPADAAITGAAVIAPKRES